MRVKVLGAGPAGSTAALYLAGAGVDVELLDKVSFPRVKPCAGGLFNPEQYFRDFPHVEEAGGTPIHRILIRAGSHAAEHVSKTPLFQTTLRKEFDHFLLKKAIEKGAAFRVAEAQDRFVGDGCGRSRFDRGGGKGGFVIDARGVRRSGVYPACGVCMVRDLATARDGDTVHVHYGFMGIKGYCWVYPKKGYVNIGVGAYLPRRNIRDVYERYLDYVISEGVVSIPGASGAHRGARPLGALLPFAPRRRFHTGRTLLTGDAAGFVNPSTGEGIYFAMLSGKLAARTVLENRTPAWYEDECRRAFGRYLKPVRFGWSTSLLNRVLEKAVETGGRDERFMTMIVENFVRFGEHNLTGRFLRGLLFFR